MRSGKSANGSRIGPTLIGFGMALALLHLPGCNPGRNPITSDPGNGGRASAAKFTDITKEAGLDFIQHHGGCGERYFVEQVAAGAAIFDANGDGFPDIYFPGPKPL